MPAKPVNALNITSSGIVTFDGVSTFGTTTALSQVVNQVFTTSGTYTPAPGMQYCQIQCLGGGAAGGGAPLTNSVNCAAGGGGGGGEYAVGIFSAATIGVSQAITIGAGGVGVSNAAGGNGATSSVGALITAFGGTGGHVGIVTTTCVVWEGGPGGTGGAGGDYRTPGSPGGWSVAALIAPGGYISVAGIGAPSQLGAGGNVNNGAGLGGRGYGSGGSGSSHIPSFPNDTPGGNGSPGIIIITEYI